MERPKGSKNKPKDKTWILIGENNGIIGCS
jgi:hypothetical protein